MNVEDGELQVIRIFESYGWQDATDIAERLKASLEESGYRVWIDREHMRADEKHFSVELEGALAASEVVVALLSPHSVRGQSADDDRFSFCYNELRYASELGLPIVPVKVRQFTGPPPFLIITDRRVDWLDWERPEAYQKGLVEITIAIDQVLSGETLVDPEIAFQTSNFAAQLRTAADTFTGRDWVFERVTAWLAGSSRCLMVEGDTGSGKTALVAELLRRNVDGRLLAYHFCTPSQITREPLAVVRSVAGMLANGIDAYADKLWNGRLAGRLTGDPADALSEGVLEPLRELTMDGNFYLVVDGLDEAVGGPMSLPTLLAAALPKFPPWLKLLVTSRPHSEVQPLFPTAELCALNDASADNRHDLHSYVAQRLVAPAIRDVLDAEDRDAALRRIELSAAGNFQYATSVLDDMAAGRLAMAQLDTLPPSLRGFYFVRAKRRFPSPADFRLPRIVLEVLLVAREPLATAQLAQLTGLEFDTELHPTLNALSGFAAPNAGVWRVAHKSIADWLTSDDAADFRVDPAAGRGRILAHCRGWDAHHETYALKYAVTHLLEAGELDVAVHAVQRGLFAERATHLHEPRLDTQDSRLLTEAMIDAEDARGIVLLAQSPSTWQRDGVASALQSAAPEAWPFIDRVVADLLAVGR